MTAEERSQTRFEIYRFILFKMQLLGMYGTYGAVEDEFTFQMNQQIGECTEEDVAWLYKELDRYVKLNAVPPKKKREKKQPPQIKILPCKKENGTWYYKKIVPADKDGGIIYELYDASKTLRGTFGKYRQMFAAISSGDVERWLKLCESKFYDKNGTLIEPGMSILFKHPDGHENCVPITEKDGILYFDNKIPLADVDITDAKICFIPGK